MHALRFFYRHIGTLTLISHHVRLKAGVMNATRFAHSDQS
jgi:hypothetical protein